MRTIPATASVEELLNTRRQEQSELLTNHLHFSVDQHLVLLSINGQLHLYQMPEGRTL